jgi:hypothetical protein
MVKVLLILSILVASPSIYTTQATADSDIVLVRGGPGNIFDAIANSFRWHPKFHHHHHYIGHRPHENLIIRKRVTQPITTPQSTHEKFCDPADAPPINSDKHSAYCLMCPC